MGIGINPDWGIRLNLVDLLYPYRRRCYAEVSLKYLSDALDKYFGIYPLEGETPLSVYLEQVFEKSRPVLYDEKYKESPHKPENVLENFERDWRAKFFETLGSIGQMKEYMCRFKRVFKSIVAKRVGFLNWSLSEEFRSTVMNAMVSLNWERVESLIMPIVDVVFSRESAAVYHAVVVWATLFLSVVHQYLIDLIYRGGTKIHSSGSLEFRSTYISIVLFQGSYVWIKSREVAGESGQRPSSGVVCIRKPNKQNGVKYEPRFRPDGPKGRYISVGYFKEKQDAETMIQIVAFYYGEGGGVLRPLGSGNFVIPPMTEEESRLYDSEQKAEEKFQWVKKKAKEVFEAYRLAQMGSGASDQAEGDVFLGNQGDCSVSEPRDNCNRDAGPSIQGMQGMSSDTLLGNVDGDCSRCQHESSQETQADNTAVDVSSGILPLQGQAIEVNGDHRQECPSLHDLSSLGVFSEFHSDSPDAIGQMGSGARDQAGADVLLGNQGDRSVSEPQGNCSRDAGQVFQPIMTNISANEVRVPGEEPLKLGCRQCPLLERQITALKGQVTELEQQKAWQMQMEYSVRQESQIRLDYEQSENRRMQFRMQELELQHQELQRALKREGLGCTEHSRKRSCSGLNLRHDSGCEDKNLE